MQVDQKTLEKIAHLSRLELDPGKREKLLEDFNKMVAFVEKLKEVDTTGVEPLTVMASDQNIVRDDEPLNTYSNQNTLRNGPQTGDGFFLVPKVIK